MGEPNTTCEVCGGTWGEPKTVGKWQQGSDLSWAFYPVPCKDSRHDKAKLKALKQLHWDLELIRSLYEKRGTRIVELGRECEIADAAIAVHVAHIARLEAHVKHLGSERLRLAYKCDQLVADGGKLDAGN